MKTAPKSSLTVYPDGTSKPGITFETANGFVSRVVSAIANSDRMGCTPDAREVARILNEYFANGGECQL